MRRVWCWLLAITAFGSPEIYGASKARLLWELKFSAILADGPGQSRNLQARDLAYSPDGNWIAAVVGPSVAKLDSQDDLLLIPSSGRADQIRRIHLDGIGAVTSYGKDIFWSPDGVHVAVRLATSNFGSSFSIFRASDGETIYRGGIIDEFLGFVDNHRFLVRPGRVEDNYLDALLRDHPISVFDLQGEQPAEWPLSGTISAAVFGPPGIAGVEVQGEKSLVIVEPLTGKMVRRDPVPQYFPRVQFGDGGRIYCLGRWPARTPPPPISVLRVRCVDALTGKEFLPMGPVRNGEPFDVARDVPVLAATDGYVSHLVFHLFDETDIGYNFSSVGIWNLRRGIEIVQLKAQKQRQRAIGFKGGFFCVLGSGSEARARAAGRPPRNRCGRCFQPV